MEKLIITTIRDVKYKQNQPTMEEIYYGVRREKDDLTMDEFKSVFDEMVDTGKIGKVNDRDYYFINHPDRTRYEEDKLQHEGNFYREAYINELKHQIDFLKEELVKKNNIISSLISKISNPLNNVETAIRPRKIDDKKEQQQENQNLELLASTTTKSPEEKIINKTIIVMGMGLVVVVVVVVVVGVVV